MKQRERQITLPIGSDEDGSVATEFAITLPIFLVMLFSIIEIGWYFFLSTSIENAVLSASRFGVTGAALENGVDRQTQIRNIIMDNTFGVVDEANLSIETLVFEQFADIGEPEPFVDENGNDQFDPGEEFTDVNGNGVHDEDLGVAGLGGSGDIVLYRVTYRGASLSGVGDLFADGYTIQAAVAVRNEPFAAS